MPSVFLSYARTDLPLIEQLERLLNKVPEISVWRDQEKIYGGQKWPKVLGEKIGEQDLFLLAWSKAAADSHFVEFEWNTAIALKKTIIPCLLDSTTLPPSLVATHGIPVSDIPRIIAALTAAVHAADAGRRAQVVRKLSEITTTKPEDVLATARTLFDQQNWTIKGNVYQAQTINISNPPAPPPKVEKNLIHQWQLWVGIAVGLLTLVTLSLDLPQKWRELFPSPPHSDSPPPMITQPLAGQALDETTNQPLGGVLVSLPDYDMKKTTEPDGHFRFQVGAPKQLNIKFTAQKEGYKTYFNYATLGNTDLRFALEKNE